MKKILIIILISIFASSVFAQENNKSKLAWRTSVSVVGMAFTKTDPVPVKSEGEVHFAPVTDFYGIIPVPMINASLVYSTPIHLSDNILFSGSRISFSYTPVLNPMSLNNQFSFSFVPTPILSFRLGCNIGTAWSVFGYGGIGIYDEVAESYDTLNPFEGWEMDVNASARFMFDMGILFPSKWTHIITSGSYTVTYSRCLNASDGDFWDFSGKKDQLNGFKYSANAMLGYMLPFKGTTIAFQSTFGGLMDPSIYGKYRENFNADFVDISFSLSGNMTFDKKNSASLSVSIPSRKAYKEETKTDESKLKKNATGREWYLGGVMLAWNHSF